MKNMNNQQEELKMQRAQALGARLEKGLEYTVDEIEHLAERFRS